MDDSELKVILEKHQNWVCGKNGGERANLEGANLERAHLEGANLEGANLDFSCWPLWCGSKHVKVDKKIAVQLIAHICVLDCEDKEIKAAIKGLLPLAKQCHRAQELGLLGEKK